MSGTSLRTLITYNPWSIGPTALLADVTARFEELRVHHVAVVDDERRVIGMLSEGDLLRARHHQRAVLVGAGGTDAGDCRQACARDVMSSDVLSISPEAGSRAALSLLLERQIHALPVVENERLIGIISSRDFVREFSYGELAGTRAPVASLLVPTAPQTLSPEATLEEALHTMHASGVSCLVVAQGDCPVGVISERDIVREQCRQEEQAEFHPEMRLGSTLLKVARSSPAIRSGQRLFEAAVAIIEQGLPAVTVVNQSNRLLGLITEDDLLRVLYIAQA